MSKKALNTALRHKLLRPLIISAVVVLCGLVLAISPLGRWLEVEISLPWLFQLRGEMPAPADVVIVTIDQFSSKKLGLPNIPRKWPRHLHGELVDKLHQHGASAIAFDIIFEEEREAHDNRRFADAMTRSNKVMLFQNIKQEILPIGVDGDGQGNARIERLVSPIPTLADSAIGLSPFPLPIVPAKVNHFLLYKPELGNAPTLPVSMLQLHCIGVYEDFIRLLAKHVPADITGLPQTIAQLQQGRRLAKTVRDIRDVFDHHPQLHAQIETDIVAGQFAPAQQALLSALTYAYSVPHSLYLNFYGRARSIHTVPYYQVLTSELASPSIDVKDKAVFVGFAAQFQPEQKDGFYTVFTESGLDISGVEIMATAFANLLQQNALQVPDPLADIVLILLWGIGITLLMRYLPGALHFPVALVLALGYFAIAYYAFAQHHTWLPVATPLLVQLPLATVLSFFFLYRDVQRERRNIREAFGYHLPVNVVDQIAKGMEHVTAAGEKVQGIVMATDAEQYTALSETLAPDALHALMNEYYATLFKPISAHNGIVSDVVGDAAMAIWAKPTQSPEQHQLACLAALQIQTAIQEFNQAHPTHALPTRIGLHSGDIVLGHVGALDHYEYRAIGDIVNTASRIEGINKLLGTHILLSESIKANLTSLLCRAVGQFQLAGKQTAIHLYELVGVIDHIDAFITTKINAFEAALALFSKGEYSQAKSAFAELVDEYGDGPSAFYLARCEANLTHNVHDEKGVIHVKGK